MIRFTLLGGPSESKTGAVNTLGNAVICTSLEGVEHTYTSLNGSWFTRGPGSTRQDEEAYFFHSSLVAMGEAKAISYAEAAGY